MFSFSRRLLSQLLRNNSTSNTNLTIPKSSFSCLTCFKSISSSNSNGKISMPSCDSQYFIRKNKQCTLPPARFFNTSGSNLVGSTKHSFDDSLPSTYLQKMYKQRLLCQSSLLPGSTITPCRSVIMIGHDGKKHNDQDAVDRFRRLGNGMWLRKQAGFHNVWKKFLVRRKPWKVFRMDRTVICNRWQSKMLDKMVTDNFKKQKWYVDDLYKGYTEETQFYYHPKVLPWNSTAVTKDHFKYAVHRNKRGNHLRKIRREKHAKVVDSYRQKPIPKVKNGFSFA